MTLQRIDRMSEPPEVGKFYLVPAIAWEWRGLTDLPRNVGDLYWPVIGNKHNDIEFFNFENLHYHVDPRFFTKRHWSKLYDRSSFAGSEENGKLLDALATPVNSSSMPDGPPSPQLRRMRCSMSAIPYSPYASRTRAVQALNKSFQGQKCSRGKLGWICPHRQVPLGSMTPVEGIITCPLHGMRVNASTGECIGPVEVDEEKAEAA